MTGDSPDRVRPCWLRDCRGPAAELAFSLVAKILSLAQAVSELIGDGDTVALEGFTHLIPFAAAHEIIRQGRRDLTLVRMTPDIVYDQLIGAGCAGKLIFSWGGNPGVGSLHRMRDAVTTGWPAPLQLEEHSHAGMANRYVAGASGLPFAVLRGYQGTDLPQHTPTDLHRGLPVHRGAAGRGRGAQPGRRRWCTRSAPTARATCSCGASPACRRRPCSPPRRALVTVEELVDELEPVPGAVVLPSWVLDAVAVVPGGAAPSYAHGYYDRDNAAYQAWDRTSRDRDAFTRWLRTLTEDAA